MLEYIVIIIICLCAWKYFLHTAKINLLDKHVLITGGSSGIGLGIAKEIVSHGGKVTLFARNFENLKKAKNELIPLCKEDRINIQSVDITESEENLVDCVNEAQKIHGPIYMLVNCAGFSIPIEFDKMSRSQLKSMFDVNFFGTFYLTQIITKSMKKNNIEGKILFVSSLAGLFGFYGLTGYSASKAAVIKTAEALYQELKPFGISVTVALPPDTDTPGFHEEEKTKPIECDKIANAGGLYQADEVASSIVKDVFNNKFFSTIGFNGHLLTCLCADMSPFSSIFELCCQVMFGGLVRLISVFYLFTFDRMIQKEHQKKGKSEIKD